MRRVLAFALVAGCGAGATAVRPTAVSVTPVAPAPVSPVPSPPASNEPAEPRMEIAASSGWLCARADGRVYCANTGELDGPLLDERHRLEGVVDARSLAIGQSFACVSTRRGTVHCYGDNTFGQLGAKIDAERTDKLVEVVGVTHARRVFAGPWHACATLEDGSVRCWGRNERGQTGSDTVYRPEARQLAGASEVAGVKASQLAAAFGATCALTPNREITCWGARPEAHRSSGPPNQRPTLVPGLTGLDEVAASESGFCGVQGGKVLCWGEGRRLVVSGFGGGDEPVAVPGITNAKHVALAGDHGCALLTDGRVACFGLPYSGALGRPADESSFEPVPSALVIEELPRATAVAVSSGLSCALTSEEEIFCWGRWYTSSGRRDEPTPFRIRLH